MEPEAGSKRNTKNWFARHKLLTAAIVFFGLAIIGAASGGGNNSPQQSTPAKSDKPASQASPSTAINKAAPTPQVLLDIQGSGTKQTQKFTAGVDWDLEWSYDCSNYPVHQGNFIVSVYNGDGSLSFENSAVNQLGAKGSDVQHYHKGGTFYLDISSECTWHVTVKG